MAAEPGPRLRVALNAAFWGRETVGSGQYLHHLVEALVRLPDAPQVDLCGPAALRAARPLPAGVSWREVAPSPLRRLGPNLEKVWFEQVAFPRAAKAAGAAVAHVPYFGSALRSPCPMVVTVHDLIPLVLPAYRSSALVRLYTALVSQAARRAALVLTDSEATRTEVVRRLGIPPARVRAVPLAAGPAYRPVEDPWSVVEVRSRYGLPEQYFLYLGGFDQRKNLDTLFRAVAEARRREPGLPPLAVAGALPTGDTPLIPDPRRLAREAGLEGGVSFLGRVAEEDKPPLYAGAVAFLFPSRYEGFGLPALEALACGAPVVSACATSLREVVGEAGLLVDPDDVPAWAEAIVQLARNEELRTRLRTLGLVQARHFSWERTARETALAYRMAALDSVESVE